MSASAKTWEVDAQERSRRARSLLIQAALWAPSMAERDIKEPAAAAVLQCRRQPKLGK